jgi:hypothetical protein
MALRRATSHLGRRVGVDADRVEELEHEHLRPIGARRPDQQSGHLHPERREQVVVDRLGRIARRALDEQIDGIGRPTALPPELERQDERRVTLVQPLQPVSLHHGGRDPAT